MSKPEIMLKLSCQERIPDENNYVGFEVLTVVVMKILIFRDIAQCSPYISRRFGRMHHLYLRGRKSANQETRKSRWQGRIILCHHSSKFL
jgi:hypothetical protein